jgi:uncharacterized membrane protein YGL010W
MQTFQEHMQYYRAQHTTLGCKVTHMFGVPIIAASVPMLFLNWQAAAGMFAGGWALQFIGHYVFEKNNPVFLDDVKDPHTYAAALVFVSEEWAKVLTGKPLVEPTNASTMSGAEKA